MVRIRQHAHPGRPLGCDQFKWSDGPACILFYTNSTCIFCPAAKEMLEEKLQEHDLPVGSIREVDCDREDVGDVNALPTILICGQTIVGLPEEDMLEQALWLLQVNPCFIENQ